MCDVWMCGWSVCGLWAVGGHMGGWIGNVPVDGWCMCVGVCVTCVTCVGLTCGWVDVWRVW